MSTTPTLTGTHLRTYETIFQHPISHNLEWRAVHSLLENIALVVEQPNGNLRVTRLGQTIVLLAPRTKDVTSAEEIMTLRKFLKESTPEAHDRVESSTAQHWLVVINHREARIFRSEMSGSLPLQIKPHAPEDFFRHAPHSKEFSRGQEKPDPNSFFEPVAKALQAAGQILIFGAGTGTSSEREQFVAWLKTHHPAVAVRIIGSVAIDESHLTNGQLLAKAREFYGTESTSAV